MSELPVDLRKLENSEEAKRLLNSLRDNIRMTLADPDSSIGLTLNAIFVQLSEKGSMLMNEADFSMQERILITMFAGKLYTKLKGE